jgi:hypothetical protein
MRNAGKAALFGALLFAFSGAAKALDYPSGFYVEGALGYAKVVTSACESLPGTLPTQFACKEDDSAWEVIAGWQPMAWFGVEAGYVNLGQSTASAGATNFKAKVDGGVFAVTFTAPGLKDIGLYGRLGAFSWEGELSGQVSVLPPGLAPLPVEDDGISPVIGIGFRWPLGEHVGLGLRWDRYFEVGADDFFSAGKTDIDNFSARLTWNF